MAVEEGRRARPGPGGCRRAEGRGFGPTGAGEPDGCVLGCHELHGGVAACSQATAIVQAEEDEAVQDGVKRR